MKERVVAVIEARMGSTRLPGKSMMPVGDAPLVGQVLRRVQAARCLDDVVVATSTLPADDVLAEYVTNAGVKCFRGSETDVLSRILGAARSAAATVHVQCWGDCAFLDPTEVDRVVQGLRDAGADLATNSLETPRALPYGLDLIALRVEALEVAERETRDDPYHREHGTTFLYETPGRFRVVRLGPPIGLAYPKLDLTVNTAEDLAFVRRVYEAIASRQLGLDARSLLGFLREHPELLAGKNEHALDGAAA
jgi:spore coat polysaccharide biosynthesis protein SpsF (cytidylyltransferase family)